MEIEKKIDLDLWQGFWGEMENNGGKHGTVATPTLLLSLNVFVL
jgi:hypothetical protein